MKRIVEILSILLNYFRIRYLRRFKTRQSLENHQFTKLRSHLEWIRDHSPYFSKLLKGDVIEAWKKLPHMNKKVMMENFDTMNTAKVKLEDAYRIAIQAEETRDFSPTIGSVTVGLSSGTSGQRGIFMATDQERRRYAGTILAKALPRGILHGEKIALFMRANSNLYSSVGSRRIQFEFFDLITPFDEHTSRLNHYQPSILLAPPSMLRKLADAFEIGKLKISPFRIYSVAEVLDPLDQKILEQKFKQKIHQIYQATEGFLAITCSRGVLHLNEDCLIIEKFWVDEKNRKFMPLITDFSRSTQPIIKYCLNDILTEKETPCECGSPLTALESIEGRKDDTLIFLDSNGHSIDVYPDFARRCVLFAPEGILAYRILQTENGKIKISLQVSDADSRERIESGIRGEFEKLARLLNSLPPSISFDSVFEDQGIKKLRRVERRV